MRRLTSFVCFLTVALLGVTTSALAQFQGPPEISIVTPENGSTRHALNPKIRVEWSIGGQCIDDGSGGCDPDTGTLVIKVNGVNKNRSFTIDGGGQYAQNGTSNAGNINLNSGGNSIYATICNAYDCAEETISVTIQANPQQRLYIDPMAHSVFRPDACEAVSVAPGAAFACDALVLTHAIPGYVSQGALRSVALVYSSRSALAQVTVPANVKMIWDAAATTVEAWLRGATDSTYWNGPDWDGTSQTPTGFVWRRIALSRAERADTGGYIGRDTVTFTIRIHTAAGTYDSAKVDTLPFYFERNGLTTPIARGWSISGMSRLYGIAGHNPNTSAPTGDVLVVGSGGAIAYFKYSSTASDTVVYLRPYGVLASLTKFNQGANWRLLSIDGTRQWYSWVPALGYARLDSITTPAGKTSVAYRSSSSGDPASITDPMGKIIRFDYNTGSGVGKLYQVCAPAGANERCTTISYGTSSGNTVVTRITDPDGGVDSLSYGGTPHWAAVTSYKPRGRGWYAVTYHANVKRPSGVVQPSSSDTLHYLAPQLAAAAVAGGTSGNPATAVPMESWGYVQWAGGRIHYFAVDGLGNVTLAKDATGEEPVRIYRDGDGQIITYKHYNPIRSRTYNGLGAVIKYYYENGDTNYVSYGGACASSSGYPCLPTQRIVSRAPNAPDTTKWYYTNELVDSTYRSNFGITRFWYGSHAHLDSVVDPAGHRKRFVADGAWGNDSLVIGDTVKVCAPCVTVRDTTINVYDVATGRLRYTRRGSAGRRVEHFRDRIARDTMVVDSAQGGGAAITTKTRYNDAARTITVVDGNGHTITFLQDDRGRRIRRTDPAGARDTFAYNGNDQLVKWTTRRGDSVAYAYDYAGRIHTKYVQGDGTWTYGYDYIHGMLDTLITPSASVYRTYNWRGWMTQEQTVVSGVTRTVQYSHNQAGALTGLTDPWSGSYTFGWDVPNRARTVINPFSETYGIRYASDGLPSKVVFPTGSDTISYNADHQVMKAGLNGEVTYERDPVTKGINKIVLAGVTERFTYDGFSRLASDSITSGSYGLTNEGFAYDAAGNRTASPGGYSYTTANAARGRPTISGDSFAPGDSLVYDAAGNPIWWKNKTTAGYDSLTWDAENRLIRLRRYSSGGSLQLDINYLYDGLGRRVKKWGTGVTTTLFVWDGWTLLAETDGSGNASRRYTYHPEAMDFPLAMRVGSTTTFFHRDGQGNVYLLTNTSGSAVSKYRYRAWGDRYNLMTENVVSPFGYKGQEEDRETGLVYMRYRYYSPRLERFLKRDPLGLKGGLNVYSFAGTDPCNKADPYGMEPVCDQDFDKRLTPEILEAGQGWAEAAQRKTDLIPTKEEGFAYEYAGEMSNGYLFMSDEGIVGTNEGSLGIHPHQLGINADAGWHTHIAGGRPSDVDRQKAMSQGKDEFAFSPTGVTRYSAKDGSDKSCVYPTTGGT